MVKIGVFFWMFIVIFVYLLLFGPPEFWFFMDRIGLYDNLLGWVSWLQSFFSAGYLS